MRIGFVSTYPPIHCGVGEYTRMLSSGLKGRRPGLRITVLAEEGVGKPYTDTQTDAPVLPSFKARSPQSFKRILDRLQELGGVDVLHVQHEYGIYGRGEEIVNNVLEAREEGLARRVVFTLHTVYHHCRRGPEAGFQEAVMTGADAVIVHSPIQEYELQAQADGYPRNLYRIPHGTSVNPYLGTPRLELARRLGLDKSVLEGFIVGFAGFLRPDKGLDTLAEALGLLGPGWRSGIHVLVGGEVRDEKLARLLEDLKGRGVTYMPRYLSGSEILMLAALSDVIVLPYKDPPGKYSVSGILHMSMGSMKPIIGSNTPRLSELYTLTPRLVFRAGDPGELARRLEEINTRGYYDVILSYASPLYSYAVRTSWPRMAGRHISLYERLLRKELKPSP